jgi:hypothetical protein
LEVSPDASDEEIRSAYRRLAQEWHPDQRPDNAEEADFRFKEINLAYEVLSDPQNRRLYDLTLEADLDDPVLYNDVDDDVEVIEDAALEFEAPSTPEEHKDEPEVEAVTTRKDDVWSPYERPASADPTARKAWSGCSYCGSIPARDVSLVQDGAWFLWRTRHRLRAALCRDCGISEFRRLTNLTLVKGWWGPLPFFSNLQAIAQNTRERARLRKLVPPAHPMQSDRKLLPPLNPGRPIYLRTGLILSSLVFGFLAYVGVTGAFPGITGSRPTGAAGLVQSHVSHDPATALASANLDAQSLDQGDWTSSGDPGAIVEEDEDAGGVASLSVFQSHDPDAIGGLGETRSGESDVRATPRNRLRLQQHAVLILSISGLHEMADIEVALGLRKGDINTGLPSRTSLLNWKALKLDPRKPFHTISWLKDGVRSSTVLYPMLQRRAINRLISDGKELPGESRVIILTTPLGNLYLQDFGTHIAFSNSPIPLAEGEDLLGPLSQRLSRETQALSTYDLDRSIPSEQEALLEELGRIRQLLESARYPSHGIAVLGWTVYGSHKILKDHVDQIDEVRFRIGQTGKSLEGTLEAQVLRSSHLYSKLSTLRTHSPVPIIGVSPSSYMVVGLDRSLSKQDSVKSRVLAKLKKWIDSLAGAMPQTRPGLDSAWESVEDVVLSLSYNGKSGHTLMTSTWVNDRPFGVPAKAFLDSLLRSVAKKIPLYVSGSPKIRGESWFEMLREMREATRFGLVRADPLDDDPLYALGLKVSGSPTSRGEGPGFKAFLDAFGGRIRFAAGKYTELFVMGIGPDALSEGWLAVQAQDLEHRPVRDLIARGPGNPQLIFWSDLDKLKKAFSKLQTPLCNMPYAGSTCSSIKDFNLTGKLSIVAGHEEGTLKLFFDVPYDSIQTIAELRRLWGTKILPNQAAFQAMMRNMLGGPRKYALAPSKNLRRSSRLNNAGNRSNCRELQRRVCIICGEESDACKRYKKGKRRHCGTELAAIDKLIGFGRSTGICGASGP